MEIKYIICGITIIGIISVFIFFVLISRPIDRFEYNHLIIQTPSGEKQIFLEIADDYESRMRGLMYRESLPENSGMLFIFEGDEIRTFWMKNTLLTLDIIFINSEMEIVHIEKNVQPCKSDPCQTYPSQMPAKYVLEVSGGFSDNNGINIGSIIELILK